MWQNWRGVCGGDTGEGDLVRSRTVLYIPDPFAADPLPIAVVVEAYGRTVVEPIPVLADLSAGDRWCIGAALDDLREAPSVDVMPVGCGPQVVFGEVHDPFKSLPAPVFDALGRALNTPENAAAFRALVKETWESVYGGRCAQ